MLKATVHVWRAVTARAGISLDFSSPAPFANTCNQKQGASQSPNQETRNAQQEKMMIDDNIWRGRGQQMKTTCKIL